MSSPDLWPQLFRPQGWDFLVASQDRGQGISSAPSLQRPPGINLPLSILGAEPHPEVEQMFFWGAGQPGRKPGGPGAPQTRGSALGKIQTTRTTAVVSCGISPRNAMTFSVSSPVFLPSFPQPAPAPTVSPMRQGHRCLVLRLPPRALPGTRQGLNSYDGFTDKEL